jgi:universal stress protein E
MPAQQSSAALSERVTMRGIRRILVAVKDPGAGAMPGVIKAARLAAACGARLELFHGLSFPVYVGGFAARGAAPKHIVTKARARCLRRLEAVAARIRSHGLAVDVAVEADFPAYEAVIRRASRTGADLIVADTHAGRHSVPWLLELTHWELIRHSAVPVLVVRSRRPYRRPVVLAAVDPLHANAKPSGLDREILVAAATLKDALRGTLHAVHGFGLPAVAFADGFMSPQLAVQVMNQAELTSRKAFDRLLRRSDLPPGRRHLVRRDAMAAIPQVARSIRADIVVMGALSRSGLRSLLIGNTAERLLDRLPCDVLVVKPARFRTDVQRARRGVRYVGAPLPFSF